MSATTVSIDEMERPPVARSGEEVRREWCRNTEAAMSADRQPTTEEILAQVATAWDIIRTAEGGMPLIGDGPRTTIQVDVVGVATEIVAEAIAAGSSAGSPEGGR